MRLNKKSSVKAMLKKKGSKGNTDWAMLKEYYTTGLDLRRPYEQLWLINLSFISGRQYTFYNRSAQILQNVLSRKGRVRVIDNKILPRYRKQISRLIRNRPVMSVVPNTSDLEDIEAAKTADKVLESFWRNAKMLKKNRELGGWIYSCGNGFLDDRWNPKKGPTELDEKTGQYRYLGDVECGVWSPLEVLVPATGIGDTDLHAMPWMIKHKFRPLEYYQKQYGALGNTVVAENRDATTVSPNIIYGSNYAMDSDKLPGAMEIQLYLQPCARHPKGLYITGANGVILNKQDYPFDYYHLEQFKDIEIPGIFWGMATCESAIWLQKLWNRTLSDIAEFNRTLGRGKWLIPQGANMQASPDDSFGQQLYYTPKMGYKPEHVTIKGLPQTYQQVLMVASQGFMEIFHQHEVSQGTNKSDIRSGEMVQLLLEQDDFGNVPTHAVFEESMEAVMARILKRIQKGYTNERTVQITGRGGEYEVMSFKGADLKGNTDVHVKKESSLPDSKVGRQNTILSRYEKGLYGDPANPETRRHVSSMLDEAMVENVYGDVYQDEQIARIENNTMVTQMAKLLVNAYDNHMVHIAEHNRFRKTHKYQALKRSQNPKEKKLFYFWEAVFQNHNSQHQQFIRAQKQQQLRELMAAKEGGI